MEKKKLHCKLTEIKVDEVSDRFYSFEGYASTFGNVDRGNDVVMRGAFSDCIKEMKDNVVPIRGTSLNKMMPVLWQHNWENPIGSFVEVREDEKGLFVKAILPKEDDLVKGRVMPQMMAGAISDMSIGFMIDEHEYDGETRMIKKATLYETSLVTIPMNPQATVTNFKSISDIEDLAVAQKETKWQGDEKFGIIESGDEITLNVYQEIEGKKTLIPEAVFKAGHQLAINADYANAKEDLDACYKRMGLESPFKETSTFRLDDEKSLTDRELESLLRSGVSFSQKTAKRIVKLLGEDAQRDVEAKSQRDAELKEKLEKLLNTF